jgi:hypothetical protein
LIHLPLVEGEKILGVSNLAANASNGNYFEIEEEKKEMELNFQIGGSVNFFIADFWIFRNTRSCFIVLTH